MIKELALYLFSSLPELAAAFLGTLGFGIVFKIKGKYLLYVSASGLFCYAIYLSALFFNCTEFVAATVAAMVVAAIAEILARTLRAPTVIFTIPGIVTIVPGSGLYYSVRYILLRDFENFAHNFRSTCYIAAGIVCGTVIVPVIVRLVTGIIQKGRRSSNKGK